MRADRHAFVAVVGKPRHQAPAFAGKSVVGIPIPPADALDLPAAKTDFIRLDPFRLGGIACVVPIYAIRDLDCGPGHFQPFG